MKFLKRRAKPERVSTEKIWCPHCKKYYPVTEFALIEPGFEWTIVEHRKCGKKFGIYHGELRSAEKILDEELRKV